MPPGASPADRICAAEVIAALSLATDLGLGIDLEHGLRSTLFAMRLCERLGVDRGTASHTYYACLLLHVGCTANAHVAVEHYGDGADTLSRNTLPVLFGSPREMMGAVMRTVAPGRPQLMRAVAMVRTLPKAGRAFPGIAAANCEVARMLTDRLGLPASVGALFAHLMERWDGHGAPGDVSGEEVPLALRIAHVARDADAQRELGGADRAAEVVRARAGGAFDPAIATLLADDADAILSLEGGASAWDATLACEPDPRLTLEGEAIRRRALGDG